MFKISDILISLQSDVHKTEIKRMRNLIFTLVYIIPFMTSFHLHEASNLGIKKCPVVETRNKN
jgi:hypothetical protein